MKYLPLAELTLMHDYYRDGLSPDLRLLPSPDTTRRLSNYRLVLKVRSSGLTIYAQTSASGTIFIEPTSPLSLRFKMLLINPTFAQITDLSTLHASPAPLFTNRDLPPANPQNLALQPQGDTLEPEPSANTLAMVELLLDIGSEPLPDQPQRFQIRFSSLPFRWVYYVTLDSSDVTPSIVDSGSEPILFDVSGRTHLNAEPDETDPIARRLAARHPNLQIWRLRSDAAHPLRQRARTTLSLRFGNSTAIETLPTPTPAASLFASDATGDTERETIVYQTVPYFTRSTLPVEGG